MTRLNRRKAAWLGIAGVGAGGVLAVAIAVPNLAFAQSPSAAPSASASADAGTSDRDAQRAKRQDEFATALAKELGVDKDKVVAALAKVEAAEQANHPRPDGTAKTGPDRTADLKARLAAAVSAGKLTQAEADAIIKASEAGVLTGPGGWPGRGHAPGK